MSISSIYGRAPWPFLITCLLAICLPASPASGDQLEIIVTGVEDPLLTNARARTQSFRISGNSRLSRRRLADLVADADELQIRKATIDRGADAAHRIAVVEDPGIRADAQHVFADIEDGWNHSQRVEEPTRSAVLAEDLPEAVLLLAPPAASLV